MSKVDAYEMLSFLGIPAKRMENNAIRTISLWNWRDAEKKLEQTLEQTGSLAQAVTPTWSDAKAKLANVSECAWKELSTTYQRASEQGIMFCRDGRGRDDWYYTEDKGSSGFASVSTTLGAPTVRQFLQRCGLLTADVEKAIQCYEEKKLPPQEILRKLSTEPLPKWENGRFRATAVKAIETGKNEKAVQGKRCVIATLTNGEKISTVALRTESDRVFMPSLPNLRALGADPMPIDRPGNRSKNYIVCDAQNLEQARILHPNSNLVALSPALTENTLLALAREKENIKRIDVVASERLAEAMVNEISSRGIASPDQVKIQSPADIDKRLKEEYAKLPDHIKNMSATGIDTRLGVSGRG